MTGMVEDPGVILDLPFRGTRSYVHSTDLYGAILAEARKREAPVEGAFTLSLRRMIRRKPMLHLRRGGARTLPPDACLDFVFSGTQEPWWGYATESAEPVSRRVAYDEERIWSPATVSDASITLEADTGMAPIEVVTALAVLLHRNYLPPPPDRKWLLVRAIFDRILVPEDARQVRLEIVKQVAGRFTLTTVRTGGGDLGRLDFQLAAV